jgi:hypothetical protein
VSRAVRKRTGHAVRALTPYALALVIAAITAFLTGEGWLFTLVAGAVGCHWLLRVHEAYSWHRKGGRAARRKRSKYQGPASWWEKYKKLSPHYARKRALTTRPSLQRSRS